MGRGAAKHRFTTDELGEIGGIECRKDAGAVDESPRSGQDAVERSLRPIALGCENYLFIDPPAGGRAASIASTLIEIAEQKGVDPLAWSVDVLNRIPEHSSNRIDEFLRGWHVSAQTDRLPRCRFPGSRLGGSRVRGDCANTSFSASGRVQPVAVGVPGLLSRVMWSPGRLVKSKLPAILESAACSRDDSMSRATRESASAKTAPIRPILAGTDNGAPRNVRIKVDPDLCEGHNRCFALAPDLFEVDDYGLSRASNDGVVPPGREEQARLAVDNCPEFAISVVEED